MTDHPILFNGAMVRAILDGRKTQTRRKLKQQPLDLGAPSGCRVVADYCTGAPQHGLAYYWHGGSGAWNSSSPFHLPYKIGDRLWVREAWCDVNNYGAPAIAHRADGNLADLMDDPSFLKPDGSFDYDAPRLRFGKSKRCLPFCDWANDLLSGIEGKWRRSIHMPRWASRLTLVVTDVRVHRLQDISGEDAEAEGLLCGETEGGELVYSGLHQSYPIPPEHCHHWADEAFSALWNATYGPEAWAGNPWVTAITFEPHRCNIDRMGEAQ